MAFYEIGDYWIFSFMGDNKIIVLEVEFND